MSEPRAHLAAAIAATFEKRMGLFVWTCNRDGITTVMGSRLCYFI
jgi:hypothetical protein